MSTFLLILAVSTAYLTSNGTHLKLDTVLDVNNYHVVNLPLPLRPQDAAPKSYVDAHSSTIAAADDGVLGMRRVELSAAESHAFCTPVPEHFACKVYLHTIFGAPGGSEEDVSIIMAKQDQQILPLGWQASDRTIAFNVSLNATEITVTLHGRPVSVNMSRHVFHEPQSCLEHRQKLIQEGKSLDDQTVDLSTRDRAELYRVGCLHTMEGGGWTPVAFIDRNNVHNWLYDNPRWTDSNVWDSEELLRFPGLMTAPPQGDYPDDVKGRAWNEVGFEEGLVICSMTHANPSGSLRGSFVPSTSCSSMWSSAPINTAIGTWTATSTNTYSVVINSSEGWRFKLATNVYSGGFTYDVDNWCDKQYWYVR